jgi:hypothetical protein
MVVRRSGGKTPVTLAVMFGLVFVGRARAAQLTVADGEGCVDANAIAEQAGELLGQPLGAVTGVDFAIALTRSPSGEWKLRLDTVDPNDGRRSRELAAASCAELGDAAAVAIAITVRARAEAAELAAPAPPREAPPTVAPPAPPPAAPLPVVARPPAPPPPAPPTFAGGLGAVVDAGALPNPAVGVELGVSLRHRRVRLTLAGTALAPQETHTTGDAGGEFRLYFGSLEACLPQPIGRLTLLGCAAFELGRLSGEGTGIARPRLGDARWQAARADLGLSIPVLPRVAVTARGGVVMPLSRPQFVVDGATVVHRPGSFSARIALGVELEF